MGTSENDGEVLADYTELGTDRFVDTVMARDLVSTANHKADEAAQHRATWVAPVASLFDIADDGYPDGWLEPALAGVAMLVATTASGGSRYYTYGIRATFAPKLRASGVPYRLRVWIAGASSDGGEVDFGVIVVPRAATLSFGASYGETPAYPHKLYTGITITTPTVFKPDDGSDVITTMTQEIVSEALEVPTLSTLTDIGGDPINVNVPQFTVMPFCQTLASGTIPRLYGFGAHEFVGPT